MRRKYVQIDFNDNRADVVFPAIIKAWENREKKLNGLVPNEIRIIQAMPFHDPAYNSWLLYLYAGLNRSHLRSISLADSIIRLIKIAPSKAFDTPVRLADYIMSIILTRQRRKEGLEKFWRESLDAFAPDDPRSIFLEFQADRDGLIKTLNRKIYGIGNAKIAHLLIFYFQEAMEFDPEFAADWPHADILVCPIDTHWHKFLRQTGIVGAEGFNSEYHCSVFRPCSQFVCSQCAINNYNHFSVINSIHYSMSLICSRKPKDPAKMARYCKKHCPIEPYCGSVVRLSTYEIRSGRVGWSTAQPRVKLSMLR